MSHQRRTIALAALAALFSTPGLAQDTGGPALSLSGFGTVGAVKTNNSDADYVIPGQPDGAGKSVDFGVDSKIGVQATATFNPMFSATAQVLSKHNSEGKWTPGLEWAFGKAKLGDKFSLRVGRMGAPFFMVSDFRDVGYTNTWIRPPLDVYGQITFSHFDGADLLYSSSIGDTNVTAQFFAGSSKVKYANGARPELKRIVGVNASAEIGPVTLRAGHAQGKFSVTRSQRLDQLFNGLRTVAALPVGLGSLGSLADDLEADSKDATFTGIGASLDWNNIVGSAEYTRRRTDSFLADTTGWYLTGGYRFGTWTPYVTLSKLKQDSDSSKTLPAAPIPQLAGTMAALSKGVNDTLSSVGQKTVAAGVRWDAMKNIAVKAQFDHIKPDARSSGQFVVREGKSGLNGKSVNVYSVAVDFVW